MTPRRPRPHSSGGPAPYVGPGSLGFDGAEDLGNMFQVKRDFEEWYCGNRDLELARRLNPELLTCDAWLARYADRIPLD
jgi:hypothetical protein